VIEDTPGMGVCVKYFLTGRGCSECTLTVDDQTAHLTATYCGDALSDLVRAVVDLLGTARESQASFMEEPGEYVWRFAKVGPDRVRIRILACSDWVRLRPAATPKKVFEAECRLRTFAGAVLSAAQEVLRTHGEDGYRREWVLYPFPTELVARLKQLLVQGAGYE
jgi:hypothetical protein